MATATSLPLASPSVCSASMNESASMIAALPDMPEMSFRFSLPATKAPVSCEIRTRCFACASALAT